MIDFKKYSNPEIVNNITDVMSAPQRAPIRIVKWGLLLCKKLGQRHLLSRVEFKIQIKQ